MDFKKINNAHFIGIGGVSMSALAMMLKNMGLSVSGSDAHISANTQYLGEQDIPVALGHSPENIPATTNLVVYTAAISEDNAEYQFAKSHGIELISRAKLLGKIMAEYADSIAVAGTHGKTTVTSMLSHILLAAQVDPTITVGAYLDKLEANYRIGNSPYFLLEACEYCNSFHNFFPETAVILNISEDHLDFFADLNSIHQSFHQFALNTKQNLVLNAEILKIPHFLDGLTQKIVSFGEGGDYHAENIVFHSDGRPSFELYFQEKYLGEIKLSVFGAHNVLNALAAAATAHLLGLPVSAITEGLFEFHGAQRRFQYKGNLAGIDIFDDYAHHPEEIAATLAAVKKRQYQNLWIIFQPHTYSRTKLLFDDFVRVLKDVDHLILADIYAAREQNTYGISSQDLLEAIRVHNPNTYYFDSFDAIENFVLEQLKPGDLLITMGAGDVYFIGESLLSW